VIWINRFRAQPEQLPGKPEKEIHNLAELPDLLEL